MLPRRSCRTLLACAAAFVAAAAGRAAEVPALVSDLAPGAAERLLDPQSLAAVPVLVGTGVPPLVVFGGRDDAHGREPWVTDGTAAGTRRIADLCPGPCDGFPSGFTAVGGELVFSAVDGEHGTELWATDGTPEGTHLVRDLCPGACSGQPYAFTALGGRVLFSAAGAPGSRREMWVSDGTAAGTLPLTARCDATCRETPRPLGVVAGELLFTARNRELWATDGTVAGTRLVRDLGDDGLIYTNRAVELGGRIWFMARDARGVELWSSDGTEAGTLRRLDQGPGAAGSWPEVLFAHGGRLYFLAWPGTWPAGSGQLFRIGADDAQAEPATELGTARPQAATILPGDRLLYVADGRLYLHAPGLPSASWVKAVGDGTPRFLLADNDRVLLAVGDTFVTLWSSDGTGAGTASLGTFDGPVVAAPLGSRLLLAAGAWGARRLLAGDGDGFVELPDPVADAASSQPVPLATFRDLLLFGVSPPGEPWTAPLRVSDGAAVWKAVGDPGSQNVGWITSAAATERQVLLAPFPGPPLRASTDGRHFAPLLVDGPLVQFLTAAPDRAGRERFFFGRQGPGQELWTSDGSDVGTHLVVDLDPLWSNEPVGMPEIQGPMYPAALTPFAGDLLFAGQPTLDGPPYLYRSDGTAEGTVPLAAIGLAPQAIVPLAGRAVFDAPSEQSATARLWATDGTAAGTAELRAASAPDLPLLGHDLARRGDAVIFLGGPGTAHDGTLAAAHDELWSTDGTAAGTRRLASLPGVLAARTLVVAGSRIFFVAETAAAGSELWTSDGSEAGTQMIELRPGIRGSQPAGLVAVGRRIFFAADDGVHGQELWTSDGTAAGTHMIADLAPGVDASAPLGLAHAEGRLYWSAFTPDHGRELWTLPLTADGEPGCGRDTLCLRAGRFAIRADWRTGDGATGAGTAIAASDETGFFWFFGPENLELLVKLLDGGAVNGQHWLFAAALTDVPYTLTVEDRDTGSTRTWSSPAVPACGIADVRAFPSAAPASAAGSAPALTAASLFTTAPVATSSTACAAGTLCLGDRYQVALRWRTRDGAAGAGQPVPLSTASGAFWFFAPSNLELLVKVLDGSAVNGHAWVFFAGLTDLELWLDVTDLATGAVARYHRAAGDLCGRLDTAAF